MKPVDYAKLINSVGQSILQSGIGKLLWHMQYSQLDVTQAVQDLTRHMTRRDQTPMDAMLRCMQYLKGTEEAGLLLKPARKWDGNDNFCFKIQGVSGSDYAKDT